MINGDVPVLWLCGPSGVGKSTVGHTLARGYLDADQIRLCQPSSRAEEERLVARNLAAMWPNYVAAGVTRFVISGCVDTAAVARSYVDALAGAKVTMCRLRADAEVVRSRAVHRGSPAGLVDDVAREVAALDATDFADHVVDTTGLSVAEVVAEVRKVWP